MRLKRILGYGALTLLSVTALAAAGGAWWLWGWRMGSLSFHESWSPEQRAELQEMANDLKQLVDNAPHVGNLLYRMSSKLELEIEMRSMLAQSYSELRRTAAGGKAPEHEPIGIPMTALAARLGKLALARELVTRGDDPNNVFRLESDFGFYVANESSFQSAIACMPLDINRMDSMRIPPAERIALLEHMLTHGATLTVPQPEGGPDARHATLIITVISALRGDEGVMAEWLMDKGFGLQTPQDHQDLCMVFGMGVGTLPTMRRIVEKYFGELSDADRCLLLNGSIHNRKDAPQKLRWALTELHADPNASFTIIDTDGEPRAMPCGMQCFCNTLLVELKYSPTEEKPESLTPDQVLEMLDLLLTHGAKLPDPERYLPSDDTLRQKYIEVINKHNIFLSTHET